MAAEIILDSGHGGFESGAIYGNRKEKDETLRLALAVGADLKKNGYPVAYTRTTDIYQSPYQKAEQANMSQGSCMISFHRNYSEKGKRYHGVQAFVFKRDSQAERIGKSILEKLADTGFTNLGVLEVPDLIILKRTRIPAVLVEMGFINSDEDNRLMDEKFSEIVHATARGIVEALPEQIINERKDPDSFFVQTGLFKYDLNAAYQLERMKLLGFEGEIRYRKPFYGVWAGPADTLDHAVDLQEQLRESGYSTMIVTE